MSEHTPDSSNGLADASEPSMEDILASIRKIIANDEVNEATSEVQESVDSAEILVPVNQDYIKNSDIKHSSEFLSLIHI